jgi:hypothetical protein
VFGDGVAVHGFRKQCAEDEDVERPLQEFHSRWRFVAHSVAILLFYYVECLRALSV